MLWTNFQEIFFSRAECATDNSWLDSDGDQDRDSDAGIFLEEFSPKNARSKNFADTTIKKLWTNSYEMFEGVTSH